MRDEEEYNAFVRLTSEAGATDLGRVMDLLARGGPSDQRLARRIEKIGRAHV